MVTKRIGRGSHILLVAALASACASSDETPSGGTPSGVSTPARGGPRGGAAPAESLDLEAMLSPVPEYEGMGRNLFTYGPPRRAANEVAERAEAPVEAAPRPAPPPRPAPRPGPSQSARLDMKYAGFLEKTGPDGGKAKYAIFLDGNEILAGTEGELLANRFTVVEIGLESVTVSPTGSTATQRIPLQSK
jgi:hypothetical protein